MIPGTGYRIAYTYHQDGARGPWKPSNLSNSDNSELSQLSELPGFLETRGGE